MKRQTVRNYWFDVWSTFGDLFIWKFHWLQSMIAKFVQMYECVLCSLFHFQFRFIWSQNVHLTRKLLWTGSPPRSPLKTTFEKCSVCVLRLCSENDIIHSVLCTKSRPRWNFSGHAWIVLRSSREIVSGACFRQPICSLWKCDFIWNEGENIEFSLTFLFECFVKR